MNIRHHLTYIVVAAITIAIIVISLFIPPANNTEYPRSFVVSDGETIRSVATHLKEAGVIDSVSLFIISSYFFGGNVIKGSYHFLDKNGLILIARDLYSGNKNAKFYPVKIPERSNVYQIADIFKERFEEFDKDKFIELAIPYHGYLYPDTYLFDKDEHPTEELILALMRETFNERVGNLIDSGYKGYTKEELLSLAAIVELEVSREGDRRKVASVLYNRLRDDIPLQVDVSFLFINGKNSYNLTREDLELDDPSNTYKNKGIPEVPITNPTVASIEAVINPENTDFFYFLSDVSGNTYFSNTYQEHLEKKVIYVDQHK